MNFYQVENFSLEEKMKMIEKHVRQCMWEREGKMFYKRIKSDYYIILDWILQGNIFLWGESQWINLLF